MLTDEAKKAVNSYLWSISAKVLALLGIVNLIALYSAYSTVVQNATGAAEDAAIARVNSMEKPFDVLVEILNDNLFQSLAEISAAQNDIEDIRSNLGGFDERVLSIDGEINRLIDLLEAKRSEVEERSAETIARIEGQFSLTLRPQIIVKQPLLTDGMATIDSSIQKITVHASVSHIQSSIAFVSVNGREVSLNDDSEIHIEIDRADISDGKVELLARDARGREGTEVINIQTGRRFPGLIVDLKSGCSGNNAECINVLPASVRRNITYCVADTDSDSLKSTVVNALSEATADWESYADIDFRYVPEEDSNCGPENNNVFFHVELVASDRVLASAFFPNEVRKERSLTVSHSIAELDPAGPLGVVGVLRHNIGHILGFRHEHTRPEAGGLCYEDDNWVSIGPYDPYSVMHYQSCGGLGDNSFSLTETDKLGVACLYGASRTFDLDTTLCPLELR